MDSLELKPKIVAFLCTWCSYAGADLAGTGRNQYPPDIRVIRIPCSGRINPIYIIKALLEGADGVMVSGCHPGDCHYLVGNYYARRRFVVLKKLLTIAGFDPDKVHFTWVSASEGARFADVVKEVTKRVSAVAHENALTPELIREDSSITEYSEDTSLNQNYEKQQTELISICKKLLEDGTVKRIIGFREGGETGKSLPFFLDSPADADRLVWNNRCVPTLSGYLSDISTGGQSSSVTPASGKTAIVAKPCDARAVVNLIVENQLKREDVYIIGMVCGGLKSETGEPLPACLDCNVRVPSVYDVLVGDKDDLCQSEQYCRSSESFTRERFQNEIDKCILCYSCRQSCYGCYCKTCFMERGEPDWQTASPDTGAKMLYHLGRLMHLSGRCVGCGSCENACASGVDIRYLIREVTQFIEETYGYQTGMDLETEPVMLTYKADDSEIGFL